jgi:hypothetical protein
MKIVIINYLKENGVVENDSPLVKKVNWLSQLLRTEIIDNPEIYIIQRSSEDNRNKEDDIIKYFVKDGFGSYLRWCDNPEELHQLIAEINPDVVHMFDLGLPMQFRWLKNHLNNGTKLIGHHMGERIWVQLRLFLQQFGLRAADAFIFDDMEYAKPYLKASVILPHQPVFEIANGKTPQKSSAQKLTDCYSYILNK